MSKPTGFLEFERELPKKRDPKERIKDYLEVDAALDEKITYNQATRCMDCGTPFCHQGCPLGNVIPEFNDLVYKGQIADAARVLLSTNNFPEVTGRVCPAPCEASCVLNIDDVPVTIKDVERTLANAIFEHALVPRPQQARSGKRVA